MEPVGLLIDRIVEFIRHLRARPESCIAIVAHHDLIRDMIHHVSGFPEVK